MVQEDGTVLEGFVDLIYRHLIDVKDDGTYRLDLDYFDYATGLRMTNDKFAQLFGGPARKPDKELLSYQYLQMLPQLAQGEANKVFVIPGEVTQALGGLAQQLNPGPPKPPRGDDHAA